MSPEMKPLGEDAGARSWKIEIGKKSIKTPIRAVMRSEINWYRTLVKNGHSLDPLPKGIVEVHRNFDSVESVSELRTKNGPLANAINSIKRYITLGFADSIRIFRPEINYNKALPPEDGAMLIELQYHVEDRLDIITIPDPIPGGNHETFKRYVNATAKEASMWLEMLDKPLMPIVYPTGDLEDFKEKLNWIMDTGFGCVGIPVSKELFQNNRSNFEYLKENYNKLDLWIHGFNASVKWRSRLPTPSFLHALPFFSFDTISRAPPPLRGNPPPSGSPKIESFLRKDYFVSSKCEYERLKHMHNLGCECPVCNGLDTPTKFAKKYLKVPTASLQIHDVYASNSEFEIMAKSIQERGIKDYLKQRPKMKSIISQKTLF